MDIQISATQSVEKAVQIFIRNSSTGAPVTGLGFGDFSPIYASREGSAAFAVTLTAGNFSEIDAADMPGFYEFTMSDVLLGTLGEIVFFFPTLGTPTEEVVVRVEVKPALVAADLSEVVTDLDEIKGVGFATGDDSLVQIRTTVTASLNTIAANVTRALGLSQENFTITGHVYDGDGNLTQSTVTIYPSRDDLILDQNEIATYTMLAAYDGDGRLTNYSVRKNP